MIKVKDERGLVRDPDSKAILRVDSDTLRDHRKKKQIMKNLHTDVSRVADLESKLDQQSTQIAVLTELVQQLLNQNNK